MVRLQPDQLQVIKGMEPLAGIQTRCVGFYFLTLGMPEATLEKAVNELLMKEAKKMGAVRVTHLRFDATPEHGFWWLSKLFGFRFAYAWGIALIKSPETPTSKEEPPAPLPLPPSRKNKP